METDSQMLNDKETHLRSHVAASLMLLVVAWPCFGEAVRIPRQLPRVNSDAVAQTACSDTGVAPKSDEDRLLVTGGTLMLTGRSQRKGGTYVVEASRHPAAACADSIVQLYLFRDGNLVGPATPNGLPSRSAHFQSFALVDPEHLRYVVADSTSAASRCTRTRSARPVETTTLLHGSQGWTLRMDPYAGTSYQARQPSRYPLDAKGHRNEGQVVVHVSVDKDGFPANLSIARPSQHRELNEAAIEYVRHSCFDPGKPSVDVPVNFSLNRL